MDQTARVRAAWERARRARGEVLEVGPPPRLPHEATGAGVPWRDSPAFIVEEYLCV